MHQFGANVEVQSPKDECGSIKITDLEPGKGQQQEIEQQQPNLSGNDISINENKSDINCTDFNDNDPHKEKRKISVNEQETRSTEHLNRHTAAIIEKLTSTPFHILVAQQAQLLNTSAQSCPGKEKGSSPGQNMSDSVNIDHITNSERLEDVSLAIRLLTQLWGYNEYWYEECEDENNLENGILDFWSTRWRRWCHRKINQYLSRRSSKVVNSNRKSVIDDGHFEWSSGSSDISESPSSSDLEEEVEPHYTATDVLEKGCDKNNKDDEEKANGTNRGHISVVRATTGSLDPLTDDLIRYILAYVDIRSLVICSKVYLWNKRFTKLVGIPARNCRIEDESINHPNNLRCGEKHHSQPKQIYTTSSCATLIKEQQLGAIFTPLHMRPLEKPRTSLHSLYRFSKPSVAVPEKKPVTQQSQHPCYAAKLLKKEERKKKDSSIKNTATRMKNNFHSQEKDSEFTWRDRYENYLAKCSIDNRTFIQTGIVNFNITSSHFRFQPYKDAADAACKEQGDILGWLHKSTPGTLSSVVGQNSEEDRQQSSADGDLIFSPAGGSHCNSWNERSFEADILMRPDTPSGVFQHRIGNSRKNDSIYSTFVDNANNPHLCSCAFDFLEARAMLLYFGEIGSHTENHGATVRTKSICGKFIPRNSNIQKSLNQSKYIGRVKRDGEPTVADTLLKEGKSPISQLQERIKDVMTSEPATEDWDITPTGYDWLCDRKDTSICSPFFDLGCTNATYLQYMYGQCIRSSFYPPGESWSLRNHPHTVRLLTESVLTQYEVGLRMSFYGRESVLVDAFQYLKKESGNRRDVSCVAFSSGNVKTELHRCRLHYVDKVNTIVQESYRLDQFPLPVVLKGASSFQYAENDRGDNERNQKYPNRNSEVEPHFYSFSNATIREVFSNREDRGGIDLVASVALFFPVWVTQGTATRARKHVECIAIDEFSDESSDNLTLEEKLREVVCHHIICPSTGSNGGGIMIMENEAKEIANKRRHDTLLNRLILISAILEKELGAVEKGHSIDKSLYTARDYICKHPQGGCSLGNAREYNEETRLIPIYPLPFIDLYQFMLSSIVFLDVCQNSFLEDRRYAVFSRITSPIGPSTIECRFFILSMCGSFPKLLIRMEYGFSRPEKKEKDDFSTCSRDQQGPFTFQSSGGFGELVDAFDNDQLPQDNILFKAGHGRVEVDIQPVVYAEAYNDVARQLKLPLGFPLELLHNVFIVASGASSWLMQVLPGLLGAYSHFGLTQAFDVAFAKEHM